MNKVKIDIDKFLEEYLKRPISIREISKKFNICTVTASRILKANNCKIYTRQDLNLGSLKIDFFKNIDTEEKAYLLGLFVTDGCVFKHSNESLQFSIALQEQDAYMIENIKHILNVPRNIVIDSRNNCHSITITNNNFVNDLMNQGVYIGKENRRFIKLKDSLMSHYLRGILDGDGCIYFRKKKNSISFNIVFAGNLIFMQELKNFLINRLDVADNRLCFEQGIYTIKFASRRDYFNITDYIYQDSTICLKRKKDKYLKSKTL